MRKLTMIGLIMICGFLAYSVPASSQNRSKSTLAVYVIAVRGDCMSNQPFIIYNGRAVLPPQKTSLPADNKQTLLTHFKNDDRVKESIEQEFKRNRAFRIVDTIAEADVVFHVCSSYWEEVGSKIILSGKYILPSHCVSSQALAIPAPIYEAQTSENNKLFDTALWRANTLIPFPEKEPEKGKNDKREKKKKKGKGKQDENDTFRPSETTAKILFDGGPLDEASPLDLAQRFIKEPQELRKQFTGFPRTLSVAAKNQPERRIPRLVTDRAGLGAPIQFGSEAAEGDEETVKIDTTLIQVPVSVMDKDGKYIPNLAEQDFQIYENGVRQAISDFGSTETPFHVMMMLDVSGSTTFRLDEMHDAAITFVNQLRPQDEVMVVSFDKAVKVATEFTNNRDELIRAILSTRTGGATRLFDAVDLAVTERLSKIEGRKAIVIFTDGLDTASRLAKVEEVIDHVEESGALVYPVCYDTFADMQVPSSIAKQIPLIAATRSKTNYEYGLGFLKEIAKRSGGRFYDVENITDTKQVFTNIAEELRRQYRVEYYPSNSARDGSYRRIRVTVNKPGVVIRARQGYRAPDGDGATSIPQNPPRPALKIDKN